MKRKRMSITAALILLAGLLAVWVVLAGELSLAALTAGLAVAALSVLIAPWKRTEIGALRLLWRTLRFVLFLPYAVAAVFAAGWKIAFLSISPRTPLRSWVFAFDYGLAERGAILLFTVLITLTPGTVVLDIAPERKRLYIHSLAPWREAPEQQRRSIRKLEQRIGRIFV